MLQHQDQKYMDTYVLVLDNSQTAGSNLKAH